MAKRSTTLKTVKINSGKKQTVKFPGVKSMVKGSMKFKKNPKKFKRVVDNKMRSYGDTDLDKRVIRINKSKKKNKRRGDIIDTIMHEHMHVRHPKMYERTVRKKTKVAVKRTSRKVKQKLYSMYR